MPVDNQSAIARAYPLSWPTGRPRTKVRPKAETQRRKQVREGKTGWNLMLDRREKVDAFNDSRPEHRPIPAHLVADVEDYYAEAV